MTGAGRLPDGTRLLHIGPHKTGTTTLQAAFHQNRDRLRAQGVRYAGRSSQPMSAAMAAATGRLLPADTSSATDRWHRLLAEIRTAEEPLVAISSEFFSEADEEHAASIVSDLGVGRTHVVVTLRPLARILPSQWQQYVQNQMRTSYQDWLDAMLNRPGSSGLTPSFWRRHRHDELVRRWAAVVGVENLTVVVLDEGDRTMVLRAFEEMLGLETGTLSPGDVAANRSLTHAEAELLRRFNIEFLEREWTAADYTRLVRFGAVRRLQQRRPGPEEARLLTPRWAEETAVELAASMAEDLADLGVRVVGDLGSLADPLPDGLVGQNDADPDVPLEVAAAFVSGLLASVAGVPPYRAPARAAGPIEARLRAVRSSSRVESELRSLTETCGRLRAELERGGGVADLGTRQLLGLLARRARSRVHGRVRGPG